jgi:hypothetical protein
MLGGMAYQSPDHASIRDLDLKNISQINSEISGTAVDVFVYDTRKDSDGGDWRKRTQNASWYNETLGTTTRGTRKEFPAVAVIVAETTKLTIYDGDDPDLPMWMVFNLLGSVGSNSNMLPRGGSGSESDITSIACLNGRLAVGLKDVSGSVGEGLVVIDFISELARVHRGSASGYTGAIYKLSISGRNSNGLYIGDYDSLAIVAETCNDVAMTVLPNAPIDDATGLPIPTIAVATDGGASLIKDNGNVYDITSPTANNGADNIQLDNEYVYFTSPDSGAATEDRMLFVYKIPSVDINNTFGYNDGDDYLFTTFNSGASVPSLAIQGSVNGDIANMVVYDKKIFSALPSGIAYLDEDSTTNANGSVAYIASDYNTGWMHGDIKGAFLSDTDTTDVEELITNGTFDSNTTGWTSHNGATITHTTPSAAGIDTPATDGRATPSSAGIIKIVSNGSASGAYQAFTTVVGKTYTASFLAYQVSYGSNYVYIGTAINGNQNFDFYDEWDQSVNNNWASGSATFTATATTTYITLVPSQVSGRVLYMDQIKVHLTEKDRSVNNKELQVYGTVTKTPVATGAELVGYGPFSASNYLQQPYNANLLLGSGDFCITGWVNNTSTSASVYEDIITFGNLGKVGYNSMEPGSWFIQMNKTHGFTMYYRTDAGPYDSGWTNHSSSFLAYSLNGLGVWYKITLVRRGGYMFTYVNEDFIGSRAIVGSFTTSSNLSDMKLHIGYEGGNSYGPYPGAHTKMALWKISKSAPSPEQVKKMYEDEKHLFNENAKATLHGSSDAVTALAYDSTTSLLHVGTSGGRSTFSGLKRVENTTTAVATAISASNGLVAEQ